jgi:integral membrane protein
VHSRLVLAYRVLAWVTGVALLVLTAAVVIRLSTGNASLSHVVAPLHGWLYFTYFVVSFALAYQHRWPVLRSVLVMLAGTIPFASFVAERRVVHWLAEEEAVAATGSPAPTPR